MSENALIITSPTALVQSSADKHPALVYLASLGSDNSRRAMKRALVIIAEIYSQLQGQSVDPLSLPWPLLRNEHTKAIRAALQARYKYTTANNALSALRGVLKTAADLDLMSADDCRKACNWKPVRGNDEESGPAGRDLAMKEIKDLVRACKADKSAAGDRDAAIIGVLYTCGLRRSELASLTLDKYSPDSGLLKIKGKGNKSRNVFVTNGAQTALDRWIIVRGTEPGALFVSINKAGKLTGKGMTAQAIYLILQKRAREADLEKFSPHDFRRTFVGDLLEAGADIVTVQKLAGHASPTTTSRYDRRGDEKKREAATRLHFPF